MTGFYLSWQDFGEDHVWVLGVLGMGNTAVAAKISIFDQPAGPERWPVAECLASSTTVPNACGISPGGWCSAEGGWG